MEKTLELEELDVDLFRSKILWKPPGGRSVFGGQVIGLGLNAALRTVNPKYNVHSLHAYFILPGDNTVPILYKVDEIRSGKTYATRSIKGIQRGKVIFLCTASFAAQETSELDFQSQMPMVPPPEKCKSEEEILRSILEMPQYKMYHKSLQMRLQQPFPVEMRKVPKKDLPLGPNNKQYVWMKTKALLPDNPLLHQCAAATLSDFELLNTALVPFDLNLISSRRVENVKMMTSLDHAIWFHRPFRADEWLLYEMESNHSADGRGFANARLWSQDGRLVISTSQEGVIRATLPKDAKL